MFFELLARDGKARAGIIHTKHGDIPTPAFMPVGTQATVKTLTNTDIINTNSSIILSNTYHLHLRPGEDLIAKFGGLHNFMNYHGPTLTDSGGFQVFSLGAQREAKDGANNVKIDADGATFRSHIDGSAKRFTPEIAIEIQKKIGADIIMAFDICTPDTAKHTDARTAMNTTHEWARRCVAAHEKSGQHAWTQFLFGIIQGANHRDLREESARFISSLPFAGVAIGGESIGYNMTATVTTLNWLAPFLPPDKPRYTMGVGYKPRDLVNVVARGADMFDCVAPTRIARNGALYTYDNPAQILNINNAQFRADNRPIDGWCDCYTCKNHSRAYLHHLFRCKELLGLQLATIHNVRFMLKVCEEMRAAIAAGEFQRLFSRVTAQ